MAIDDVVVATTRTIDDGSFSAMIPPATLTAGSHRLELLRIVEQVRPLFETVELASPSDYSLVVDHGEPVALLDGRGHRLPLVAGAYQGEVRDLLFEHVPEEVHFVGSAQAAGTAAPTERILIFRDGDCVAVRSLPSRDEHLFDLMAIPPGQRNSTFSLALDRGQVDGELRFVVVGRDGTAAILPYECEMRPIVHPWWRFDRGEG